jgi:hypothetical protein
MTEQYLNERFTTPDVVAGTGYDPSSLAEAVLYQETPVSETVADFGPINSPLADEIRVVETVAVVSPLDETIVREAPMGETLYDRLPLGKTIAGESPVSKSIPSEDPISETISHEVPASVNAGPLALLNRDQSEYFRTLWNEIQGKFVDEPRAAVQQADALVAGVVEQITHMFASEHSTLEAQWKQGSDVSTEDLRKALQHYRSFFNRLVV